MIKVITYGTYDLLHYGHIRLLERAKALGSYLIVGITAADFDKTRGKINVQQSLMDRIEAVKNTGLADEIIIEEYEGQKIDDIKRLGVDIFTVGSDWEGYFDYLKEYCKVVYLPRTEGISSSELRSDGRKLKLGIVGDNHDFISRYVNESRYVNGLEIRGLCTNTPNALEGPLKNIEIITDNYCRLLKQVDAVYLYSVPGKHYEQIELALQNGVNVLVESPVTETSAQFKELRRLADEKELTLMEACRTAYSTAYYRLLLLLKSGIIGKIVSVDATCTSLKNIDISNEDAIRLSWNSLGEWGPTAMLPVLQLLGTQYIHKHIVSEFVDKNNTYDAFTKIDFLYPHAVASIKVGKGMKSEGELIISGTKGYVYVPAPWWKMDYFEVRYENPAQNRRYFYQLDGEGIRYELVDFVKSIKMGKKSIYITDEVSKAIVSIYEDFCNRKDMSVI